MPAALVLAAHGLLWWLVAEANHFLAPTGLFLLPSGLLLLAPTWRLSYGAGGAVLVLTGLWWDAAGAPFPGPTPLLLVAGHALLCSLRGHLPKDHAGVRAAAAALLTLPLVAGVAAWRAPAAYPDTGYWMRTAVDAAASAALAGLAAPWFLALQDAACRRLGREPRLPEVPPR